MIQGVDRLISSPCGDRMFVRKAHVWRFMCECRASGLAKTLGLPSYDILCFAKSAILRDCICILIQTLHIGWFPSQDIRQFSFKEVQDEFVDLLKLQ